MAFIYPGGDNQYTPNLLLATFGMDEVLAENMILIDAAVGSGSTSVRVNGTVVPNPNFIDNSSITFSVAGSNITATAIGGGSGTVTSFSAGNLAPLFTTSVANPTTTPALSFSLSSVAQNSAFLGPVSGGPGVPSFRAIAAADLPAGTGTVTSVSSGNIDSIATVSVATPTTTPAFSFSLSNQTANTVWAGPTSGGAAAPTFRALVAADLPAGTGTVTSFSAGSLSPLFTTSVATATTTPALSFSLSNAAQNAAFIGPVSGGPGAPTFRALSVADLPTSGTWPFAGTISGNMTFSGNPRFNGKILDSTGAAGTNTQVLSSTGTGVLWITNSGSSSPGGSNGDIQYNNSGAFGGSAATITSAGSIKLPAGQNIASTAGSFLSFDAGLGAGVPHGFYLQDDSGGMNISGAIITGLRFNSTIDATFTAGGSLVFASGLIIDLQSPVQFDSSLSDNAAFPGNFGQILSSTGSGIAWVSGTGVQYAVAGLPAGNEGDSAYATDGLKVGETPGSGTGVPVYFSAGLWRVFSTDMQVQS